jgi:hypothetical protein
VNVLSTRKILPRVPRKMFRSEREEVTGAWRKQHNEEFHDLYSSPNIQVIK